MANKTTCRFGGLMLSAVIAAVLLAPMLAFAAPSAAVDRSRPISDFTSSQGTFCPVLPDPKCLNFVSSYIGWTGPSTPAPTRLAAIDFAAKEPVVGSGPNRLNTSFTGSITERALPDGRAELHIILHTRNALAQVWACDNFVCPSGAPAGAALFGHTASEVLAGAAPGVANSSLEVTLINSAPGAPIPDLVRFVVGDLPFQDLARGSFQANGTGPLRSGFGVADGTPGRLQIVQAGLISTAFVNGFRGGLADAFPVERVNLNVARP